MYLLILSAVSKNIVDNLGRKSICVTVSLRTYMYSQLIYLHFGGSYTSFTQLEAEIHALELDWLALHLKFGSGYF